MDKTGIRILIVDDNLQVRQDLAEVLGLAGRRAGLHIEIAGQAGNGEEGIELSLVLRPDVVLMDLEMPDLDGYEATRRIKTRQPAPRVVILSAHAGAEERERAGKAGADGFVLKGAACQDLVKAILGQESG